MSFNKKLLIIIGLIVLTILGLTMDFGFLRAKKVYIEAPLDFHPVSGFPVILEKAKNEHIELYPVSKPRSVLLKKELENKIISRDSLLEFLYNGPVFNIYPDNEYKFYLVRRRKDGSGEIVQVRPRLILYD